MKTDSNCIFSLPSFDFSTGHYTAMVWASTHKLGCAQTTYTSPPGMGDGSVKKFLVCNYGPAGNVKGKPVYQVLNYIYFLFLQAKQLGNS